MNDDTNQRKLGWDADGMCDDHYRFACPKCAPPAPVDTNQRAREIASELSETQARLVKTGQGSHEDAVSPLVFPLWSTIIKEQGYFHIVLNRDGLAVRRALGVQS